jgi:hypothetical protein
VIKLEFEINLLILLPIFGSIALGSQMTMETVKTERFLVKGAASKAMPFNAANFRDEGQLE